ncbi:MAG: hypothetical protein R3A10_20150 [Caldilineaceae bacterium]
MQWQFLTPDAIHLAWWQATHGQARRLAGPAGAAGRHGHRRAAAAPSVATGRRSAVAEPSRNWLYGRADGHRAGHSHLLSAVSQRRRQPRRHGRDCHGRAEGRRRPPPDPEQTQQFANVYHGRLPTLGLFAQDELDAGNQEWLARIRRDYRRVWVVPDYAAPAQSGWERTLRTEDFTLLDTRPAGSEGRRVALYAMTDAYALTQVGLGTVFGDPAQDGPVTAQNGWFRLDGYAVTDNVTVGDALLLSLAWRSLQPVDYDYQVFVHLLDAQGHKVAQRDGQPVQWLRPKYMAAGRGDQRPLRDLAVRRHRPRHIHGCGRPVRSSDRAASPRQRGAAGLCHRNRADCGEPMKFTILRMPAQATPCTVEVHIDETATFHSGCCLHGAECLWAHGRAAHVDAGAAGTSRHGDGPSAHR